MKKLLCVSLLALSVASAAGAASTTDAKKTGFYVRGDVGAGMYSALKADEAAKDKTETTPVGGVGVGYKFSDMLRADVNFQYRNIKFTDSVIVNSYAFLVNGYLDIVNDSAITPYLTAGFGSANLTSESKSEVVPIKLARAGLWNTGLGAKMKVTNDVDLDLGYRYSSYFAEKDLPQNIKDTLGSHQVLVGVAYKF